jgi:hypothetical protein
MEHHQMGRVKSQMQLYKHFELGIIMQLHEIVLMIVVLDMREAEVLVILYNIILHMNLTDEM